MADDRGAFIWYELICDDPVAAKAFYDPVIGWNIDVEGQKLPTGSSYHMIHRSDGGHAGAVLGMSQDMRDNGGKPVWMGYVCVPDVDASVRAFEEAGGALHMPAMDLPVGRIAMVSDPQGVPIYLMDPVPPEGQPDARSDVFSVDRPQHIRWNELWVPDQDAAAAFYGEQFGWKQEGAMDMGPMGRYLFIQHGETGIGAIGHAGPDGDGPRWSYAIGVDDIDRAAAAAKENGGTVSGEPQEIPGGEFSVYCTDPQGAAFGLVGPRKG